MPRSGACGCCPSEGEWMDPNLMAAVMKLCESPGCPNRHRARGYCHTHYMALWHAGGVPKMDRPPTADRFWSFVDVRGHDECWEWTGGRNTGYGQFVIGRRTWYAHRIAYELQVGPIPEGMQIDHLCRNRACQNAGHLEPVTPRENVLRSASPSAQNAKKTTCPAGHPYDEANTYWTPARTRSCRLCNRARNARRCVAQ